MRETVLESQAITLRAREREGLRDTVRQKYLLSAPLDPAEGVVDGLVYASEHSTAFGDPVVSDLIRMALRLAGARLGLECSPASCGHRVH
ncbi:hypothetical protein [Methylobacterium nigriterrae]|uniref:hypothetical protein n=1 Tax=Methylobacterium nigriterrae TaxID=3127512 RepID=UPI0030138A1B